MPLAHEALPYVMYAKAFYVCSRWDSEDLGGDIQVAGKIGKQTVDNMRAVIAPKLNAMEHLGQLCHAAPVASFVLFSSISSVAGFSGHVNYCAANATLDVHAKQDAVRGLPTFAIQWGAWSAVGETALPNIACSLISQCTIKRS